MSHLSPIKRARRLFQPVQSQVNQSSEITEVSVEDLLPFCGDNVRDLLRAKFLELESDVERLHDGFSRLALTVEVREEQLKRKEMRNKELEAEAGLLKFELDREREEHKEAINENNDVISDLKSQIRQGSCSRELIDDEKFKEELNERLKCEICLDDPMFRCCPECMKGVCRSCYIRIRGDKRKMPCPYCRVESVDWKVILMPRL